jgi:hypothetical protein
MTEAEWLDGSTVFMMLYHLRGNFRVTQTRAGRRRVRLFACACARSAWHLLEDPRSRRVVEVAEAFAGGLAPLKELTRARVAAEAVFPKGYYRDDDPLLPRRCAHAAALFAADPEIWQTTFAATQSVYALDGRRYHGDIPRLSWRPLVRLLHEIFGNPFRPVALGTPDWLAWNRGTVPALARTITTEGTFGELPVLLDALEEAGCDQAEVLAHLRGPGPHVRGCWALDLLAGLA